MLVLPWVASSPPFVGRGYRFLCAATPCLVHSVVNLCFCRVQAMRGTSLRPSGTGASPSGP